MAACRCSTSGRVLHAIRFSPRRAVRAVHVFAPATLRPEDWTSGESEHELSMSDHTAFETEGLTRSAELDSRTQSHLSPVTHNPQTGKLIDVYFEVGSLFLVVLLAGASYLNAHHVISQTQQADMIRMPAAKEEWLARDNQNVYGPCGGEQESGEALRSLLDGRPCQPLAYNRAPPASQRISGGAAQ